jgi:hypothetical protein
VSNGPLLILSTEEPAAVIDSIHRLVSGWNGGQITPSHDPDSPQFSVIFEGISLTVDVKRQTAYPFSRANIFTSSGQSDLKSKIAIGLNGHVRGGERVPPVARALLSVGGVLADHLAADAVFWVPSGILSDARYFSEVADSYAKGGAFPTLPTIHFDYRDEGRVLSTSGLSWFAGQELKLTSRGQALDKIELMKRAVRLTHDMAVNGPIIDNQVIADLDSNASITLTPNKSVAIVSAEVVLIQDFVSHSRH